MSGVAASAALAGRARAAGGSFSVLDVVAKGDLDGIRTGLLPDASAYINEAIDHAVANGFSTLRIPTGIYRLNGKRQGPQLAILRAPSNLTITGDGPRTVLIVAAHYTDGGDYRVFAPFQGEPVENLTITNITFDGNGAVNTVTGSKTRDELRSAYMLKVVRGRNILVENCSFQNCPGRGILNLGDPSKNDASTSNVVIANNTFENAGGCIPGNHLQNDHSSIYLQCDGGRVTGNRFRNPQPVDSDGPPSFACIALEVHGSNTVVSGNQSLNYPGGGDAVATVGGAGSNLWENNTFDGLTHFGLALFSFAPYPFSNLTIRKNRFTINNSVFGGNAGIYQGPGANWTTSEIVNLVIEDNLIVGSPNPGKMRTWNGIDLCAVEGCRITGNTIRNVQGCGINLHSAVKPGLRVDNVEISNNQIENAGLATPTDRIWAIRLKRDGPAHVMDRVSVSNNTINSSIAGGRMRGILVDPDVAPGVQATANVFNGIAPEMRIRSQ